MKAELFGEEHKGLSLGQGGYREDLLSCGTGLIELWNTKADQLGWGQLVGHVVGKVCKGKTMSQAIVECRS